jgi:hypothetical protein
LIILAETLKSAAFLHDPAQQCGGAPATHGSLREMARMLPTAIGQDGVYIADRSGAPQALWDEVGPLLNGKGRADLDRVLNFHRGSRAQAAISPTVAQQNRSVRAILKQLGRLREGDRLGRALIDEMIRDLGGDAGFKVFIALERLAPGQQGRMAHNIDEFDADELREALESALAVANGPKRDGELRVTVSWLLEVYESGSGRTPTHSNRKNALYEQTPQSRAGGFVMACIRAVDTETLPSAVSAALAKCILFKNVSGTTG